MFVTLALLQVMSYLAWFDLTSFKLSVQLPIGSVFLTVEVLYVLVEYLDTLLLLA